MITFFSRFLLAQHPTLFLRNPLFMKDEINRQESVRKARLRAQAKIDAEVKLQRRAYKDKWGIALDYSYRYKPTFHSQKTFYILLCVCFSNLRMLASGSLAALCIHCSFTLDNNELTLSISQPGRWSSFDHRNCLHGQSSLQERSEARGCDCDR